MPSRMPEKISHARRPPIAPRNNAHAYKKAKNREKLGWIGQKLKATMRSDAMKANTANRDPAGPHQSRSPHQRTNGMPRKRTRFRSNSTAGSFQSAMTGARKRYRLLPIVWPPS